MPRARSVEIYLKEGLVDDDRMYAVWAAAGQHTRRQELFRRILQKGLRCLMEDGDLPLEVAEAAGIVAEVPQMPRPRKPKGQPLTTRIAVASTDERSASPSKPAPVQMPAESEPVPAPMEEPKPATPEQPKKRLASLM